MDVPEIDVEELARRMEAGTPVLDVRNPDEYDEVHIPGVVLVPLGELMDRVGDVPETTGELPVVCRSGGRSLRAAEWLRSQGVDAVNVAGGTMAWVDAGLATESGGSS